LFENIAAIDIGTSAIKMVLAKKGLRDFNITELMIEKIDSSAENQEEATNEALVRLIETNQVKGYSFLINLPMEKAIIRNITFPFTDREKIAEAIPFEAQENIPFNIDDLDLDFQTIHSPVDTEGRVLVAATHSDTVFEYMKSLELIGIQPIAMGLESNALFECYSYFAYSEDENIIQLDIGQNKTIINIIRNNKLLFTRCVSIGTGLIIKTIADNLKLSFGDAQKVFEGLRLDVHDYEANLKKNNYKTHSVTKQKLKHIHAKSLEIVIDLVEQINITLKSFALDNGTIQFTRLLYSGGGSNILGLGTVLQKETGIPSSQAEFPIAFGMALSWFTNKKNSINFLKGDYLPQYVADSKKQYMLAALFTGCGIVILLLNLIISSAFQSRTNSQYTAALDQQFKRFFQNRTLTGDPLEEAEKIVKTERKELDSFKSIVPSNMGILDALQSVTSLFEKDPNFQMRNLVIDAEFIRFDGDTDSGTKVDNFKNKLVESGRFESVSLNTTAAKRDLVSFNIVIKMKSNRSAGGAK
jgi:type IV pilus assembly protein PilM